MENYVFHFPCSIPWSENRRASFLTRRAVNEGIFLGDLTMVLLQEVIQFLGEILFQYVFLENSLWNNVFVTTKWNVDRKQATFYCKVRF